MKRTVLLGVALLGLAACAPDRKADEKAILDGERVWGAAYVTGDAKAVDAILADDFVGIQPTGDRYDKTAALVDVRHGPASTSSDVLGPVTVRFYGDAAVAQGSETGTEGLPAKKPFARVWTSVWVKRNGQWKVVASHDVDPDARPPVDPPPGSAPQ